MLDWTASAPHQSLYLLERLAGAHCQFGVAKLARRRCGQGVVRAGGRLVLRLRQRLVARAGVHGRAWLGLGLRLRLRLGLGLGLGLGLVLGLVLGLG